jgi:anaerobic magnesium-protoporphyrin IX monomethyl ester cyclase
MNVLFIKPNNLADHIQPSLGLAILANLIRDKHEVEFVDCIKEDIPPENFAENVLIGKREDVDMICIQVYTFDLRNVKAILKSIKKYNPKLVTVVGGAHITTAPEDAMKDFGNKVDYAFSGEGELGFPRFVDALEAGNLSDVVDECPGLMFYKEDGSLHQTKTKLVPMEELDTVGQIAWDIIKPNTYPEAQHGAFFEQFPIAPIITTRGCPYKCTFCSAPKMSGSDLRHYSVDYILKEIKMLYDDYGIREIHIVDDNFTMDMPYAKAVLQGIIDMNLGISLAMPNGVRMDWLDDEILILMKKAGMYMVTVAIESGNDRILKLMRKGTTVKKIRKCVEKIKSHNFDVAAFFILGYPSETYEEMETTIKFSLELDLQRANYFTYLPLPGTESYNKLIDDGELDNIDWDNFYFMAGAYVPKNMSREKLLKIKKSAFTRFYLRPRIFIYNVLRVKSVNHFKFLFKRFCHWMLMNPEKETSETTA